MQQQQHLLMEQHAAAATAKLFKWYRQGVEVQAWSKEFSA
jgi:hypothetical protein